MSSVVVQQTPHLDQTCPSHRRNHGYERRKTVEKEDFDIPRAGETKGLLQRAAGGIREIRRYQNSGKLHHRHSPSFGLSREAILVDGSSTSSWLKGRTAETPLGEIPQPTPEATFRSFSNRGNFRRCAGTFLVCTKGLFSRRRSPQGGPMSTDSVRLWSIVLAGGEGERTRAFVEEWLGHHKPKQYCVFAGTRSLFQHTVDRADALGSPEDRVVVAAPEHRGHVLEQLAGRGEGRVLFQPKNRGTAPGVFLALTHVLARDPNATVVIYPSDHFVYPESAFLNVVRNAVRGAQRYPDGAVLLGVRPSTSETDYGWIVPSPGEPNGPTRRVEGFLEKPPRRLAEEALRKGALWNTMIVASKLDALWALGWRCLPEIMPAFVRLLDALRAGRDDA